MRVYRHVEAHEEACNFGCKHVVCVFATKELTDTGRTYTDDNGYSKVSSAILTDRQGREYRAHYPIDFYGGTTYESDGGLWTSRPRVDYSLLNGIKNQNRVYVDLVGRAVK